MPDQQAVTDLIMVALRTLTAYQVYWAIMVLVTIDVITGFSKAAIQKQIDPSQIQHAAVKFMQVTATLTACLAMIKVSPMLSATAYPIIVSVALGEVLSIVSNMRMFWEARGMQPPAWLDQVTVYLKGFPNETAAQALATAEKSQTQAPVNQGG